MGELNATVETAGFEPADSTKGTQGALPLAVIVSSTAENSIQAIFAKFDL